MVLDWILCHRDGQEKGGIVNREPGSSVTIRLTGEREAKITCSAEEDLTRTIHPGRTRLKVRMNQRDRLTDLIFNGLIAQPKSTWLTTEIPAVGPHFRLLNASPARIYEDGGDNSWEPNVDTDLELSELMWKVIQVSDRRVRQLNDEEFDPGDQAPTLGIIEGDLYDTGITRSWNPYYLGTSWDALQDYRKKKDYPDFILNPLDREDGIHARFDTFILPDTPTNAVFELGQNVVDIDWEPGVVDPSLCNQYVLMGEASGSRAPAYVAENKESINRLGVYNRIEQASSEWDMEQIQKKAEEYVSRHAWVMHFFDLQLPVELGGTAEGWSRDALGNPIPNSERYGVPPVYGEDYGLGDIVTVRVHNRFKFGIENDLPGDLTGVDTDFLCRVTAVTFEEVDIHGNVGITLEVQPLPLDAAVTGFEAYIAVEPD